MRKTRKTTRGVTVLELLITIFVLLIGVTGIMGLFPVGVKLSQMSCDDVISSMTAQNALAAVRLQSGLLDRVKPYHEIDNLNGDVLCWTGPTTKASDGIGDITGTVQNTGSEAPGDPLGVGKIEVAFDAGSTAGKHGTRELNIKSATSFDNAAPHNDCGLLLMTSGRAMWKLYRLDNDSSISGSKFGATVSGANFPADGLLSGDSFRLIGARSDGKAGGSPYWPIWATVPANFYGSASGPATTFTLGKGAADGYGYLAIATRVPGLDNSFRVDVLVYKGYDRTQPPERNDPAVACYSTILSGDMFR